MSKRSDQKAHEAKWNMRRTDTAARARLLGAGLGLSLALGAGLAGAAAPGTSVDLWVRRPGSYGVGADPGRDGARSIDLAAAQQQQVRHADAQYEGTFNYRGVPLRALIAQYAPPAKLDLALLRFKNGMIVPLPFRDERTMGRLDPFIALAQRGDDGKYTSQFPPLRRHVEGEYADVKQASFVGNRLVVSDAWHPDVAPAAQGKFSPWRHVDSLAGIEFVSAQAYYRQFDPAPETRAGFELFKQTCQFCHGARKVGASFGWDYVQPIELYTHRKTEQRLYYHIRYRVESAQSGALMPALRHVSEDDAAKLWQWMKAVATRPMAPYAP